MQAPAGSGKTTLLVTRYLRLLGRAERPEEVLAITFTRKAAAEMRTRVLTALREGAPEAQEALARDLAAGWRLRQQPNRLKIQTIDSFASGLVRQLPLAADFRPGAGLLEQATPAYGEAVDRLFQRLYEDEPLADELATVLALFDNRYARARALLISMLGRRDQWLELVRDVVRSGTGDPAAVQALLSRGVDNLSERIIGDFLLPLSEAQIETLGSLARRAAENLGEDLRDERALFRFAGRMLTTRGGTLRRQLTKREGFPADDRPLKAEGLAFLAELDALQLETLADNLQHLPPPMDEAAATRRLSAVAVTLLLAAAELDDLFRDQSVADFTALVIAARRALQEDGAPTELALALDYRIRHILVDEFQDTSEAQFRLFELLLQGWSPGDGNSFFAVGDPMQSIYRFRDAEVRVFFDAWRHGIADLPLEQIRLTSNFRAHEGLVAWHNRSFERILGRTSDPVLGRVAYSPSTGTRRSTKDSVRCDLLSAGGDQAGAVVRRIQALRAADDEASIGLLVRSRTHLDTLLPALRDAGIAWRGNDIDPLTTRPAVQDLLSLAEALSAPGNRLAWFALLRTPWIGLSHEDLEPFAAYAKVGDALADSRVRERLSPDGQARVERLRAGLALARPMHHEAPPRAVLETLWLAAGGADAYASPQALADAERFLALVDQLGAEAWDMQQLNLAAGRLFAEDVGHAALEILTIHKAKGLEFDHVILPFLERGTRPPDPVMLLWRPEGDGLLMGGRDADPVYDWLAREDKAREAHELERLLYVACTRPREQLHLFAETAGTPASGSLLSLLWPDVQDLQPEPAPAGTAARASNTHEAVSVRLPADFRWRPPDLRLPQPPASRARRVTEAPAPQDMPEVALGSLMHEALRTLSLSPLPADPQAYCARRETLWSDALVALGVELQHHEALIGELTRQLCATLTDADGRWVLGPRQGAAAELALTGVVGTEVENVFLDRTFVDEEGQRWIIDYKTAVPEPDESVDAFLLEQSRRYQPQLARYAALAGEVFPETLKLALYFTALPRLWIL